MANQHMHIVMIDDDDIDVEAVARLLNKHAVPFTLTVFHNGREAQDALNGDFGRRLMAEPYLILLDLNMPRMNGFEFLHWLRSHPDWQRSIIFVFTTSEEAADLERAYSHFVAGYLTKTQMGAGYANLLPLLDALDTTVRFPTPPKDK
jgi:CheY-like chemotaxis protein